MKTSQGGTFVFPNQGGLGNDAAIMSLVTAMQNRPNLDMASVMSMARERGLGMSEFIVVLFLFGMFGGGFGGFGGFGNRGMMGAMNTDTDAMRLTGFINNNDNFNRILNAVQGNAADIRALSQALNCSTGQITAGLNSVSTLIMGVGNQVGLTKEQTINAIQSGNASIIAQMQSCCCNLGQKITEQGYQNQLANCHQTNALTNAINSSALSLRDGADARHHELMARLDVMEKSAMQAKIDALQETKSTLQTQLSMEHQTSSLQGYTSQALIPLQQAVAQIQQEVNDIKSKQPPVATLPYSPAVAVPTGLAYQAGFTGNAANGTGGFWY